MNYQHQIINDYLKLNINIQNKIDLKYKSIQHNNSILELLANRINKSYESKNIDDIMMSKIKQNHINILNANLEKEIKKIKNNLSIDNRRKFKIIIIIINTQLFNYLKNKIRNLEEELIYLYTIALRKKEYLLIPNVCDDVFYKVLNKLLLIIKNLDINNINVKERITKLDNIIFSTTNIQKYKITYN